MSKKRFTVTIEELEDGTIGICLACGEIQYGFDPDSRACECEACWKLKVYGLEEALAMDAIDIAE
jgi:hypothetical protein